MCCLPLTFSTVTLLSFLVLSECARKGIPDLPFPKQLVVSNRTVSCSGKPLGNTYSTQVFTCVNITVDGKFLLHGYVDGETATDNRTKCLDCPCGKVAEPNNAWALCEALLASQSIEHQPLYSVNVPNPHCMQKGPEERVKYIPREPYWIDSTTKHGYVTTIQCHTRAPPPH